MSLGSPILSHFQGSPGPEGPRGLAGIAGPQVMTNYYSKTCCASPCACSEWTLKTSLCYWQGLPGGVGPPGLKGDKVI